MPRDVHRRDLLVQDLGSRLGELVDRVVDTELVAGDGLGGDDHRVAALDMDGGVIVVGDARQRRQRLALAAGAEDQLLARIELVELGRTDEHAFRNLHVAEVARDVGVLPHRAADDADLASELDGDVDRLLHAVHVRRERRDEDPSLPERKDLSERLADDALRLREPRSLRIRRVAE